MRIFAWLDRACPDSTNSIGWVGFQLGLFLLPSSAFLAGLFLLFAMVLGSRNRSQPYWKDSWNFPFLIAGILMFLGCLRSYSGWLAWIGLANWLPFFWGFWSFQPYLATSQSRRRSALWLVGGTVPVLITGFGQLWLGWQGPWQLSGLIIWFVASGGSPIGRLSGLFDYANIAGAWLALIWPFALAALLQRGLSFLSRSFVLVLGIAIVSALVLTDSRNAWGGLILAIPFVLGPARWSWLLPLLSLLLMPVALAVLPGVPLDLQQWARKFVPEGLWARLNDMRYIQERSLASTRMSQWGVAMKLVAERPWLGWGAAAFSLLYPLTTGKWHGHAHNLPLELAVSHGLPAAILIVGTVIALLVTALRCDVLTVKEKVRRGFGSNIFDRAWWSACFILVVLHGADMPFFDSRLNIVGWILLAGLRCLILPSNSIKHSDSKLVHDAQSISPV